MKKIIIILIVSLITFGCAIKVGDNFGPFKFEKVLSTSPKVNIYSFEGHEYIGYISGTSKDFLTHNESCPNPIHNNKKGTFMFFKDGSSLQIPDTLIEKGQ